MKRRRPSSRSWSSVITKSSRRTAVTSDEAEGPRGGMFLARAAIDRREPTTVKSTLQWATPYSLGLLLALAAAALAAFALLRWASGRPIEPARRAGLMALRVLILALIALILVNPVRVDETPGAV